MEESYEGDNDPILNGLYHQYHPLYKYGTQYVEWPLSVTSSSTNNHTDTSHIVTDTGFCPSKYSVLPNYLGDSKWWHAGKNIGGICSWLLLPPVGTYTVDDATIGLIDYIPTTYWGHTINDPFLMQGTLTFTQNPGNRSAFTFYGSKISWFYSMAPNRGTQTIYIDGLYRGFIYSYASEIRRQIAKTWDVSPGEHTIEVVNNGDGYSDLDSFAVDIATVGSGTYDDTHSQLRYFGTWEALSGIPGAYANTIHRSSITQSGMRFTFAGANISYCHSLDRTRGIAGVTIDGVYKGDLDLYSYNTVRHVCTLYQYLGSGTHIINIMVTGRKNSAATGYSVDVDDFEVPN